MLELDKKEMIIRYGTIAFVLGTVLAIAEYILVFLALDTPFSFQAIAQLHGSLRMFYLVDLIPVPAALFGAWIANWRFEQLNTLSERIRKETDKNREIKKFIHSLIAGELHNKDELSLTDRSLSETLNELRDSLARNRKMELQRRLDERQRNWISEGLAEFGDILRNNSHDMEAMSYAVISGLVRYLEANQGGLFLVREDEDGKYLSLVACHAY